MLVSGDPATMMAALETKCFGKSKPLTSLVGGPRVYPGAFRATRFSAKAFAAAVSCCGLFLSVMTNLAGSG